MSKEIALLGEFDKGLAQLETISKTCKMLASSPTYRKYGEEGICAIVARAKALNIDPFQALNTGFYVVQGKIGMTTEMMAALVRRAGHSITKDPKSDNETCVLHGKRGDNGDTWTCSFSRKEAETAGLWGGPTWKKYPSVMLYNRCMSMLFRQLFPDLSLGAGYAPDEINEITKTGDYSKLPEGDVMVVEPQIEQEVISSTEVAELQKLIDQLTEKAQHGIMTLIKMQGFDSLDNISHSFYPLILKRINATLKAIEEAKSKEETVVQASVIADDLPF